MSYTIQLETPICPTCGHREAAEGKYGDYGWPEPTYNLTPIFDLAITGEPMPNPEIGEGDVVILGYKTERPRGLCLLSGNTGKQSIPIIRRALDRLWDKGMDAQFQALVPENGWGTLEGAVSTMQKLEGIAAANPDAVWRIS